MTSLRDGGVVVANPSSNPETFYAAAALAEARLLDRYHVPIASTAWQERVIERWAPAAVSRPVLKELRRRPIPPGVSRRQVKSTAIGADLARVVAVRAGAPSSLRTRLAHRHRAVFDAGVANRLRAEDRAILAVLGTATETVRTAKRRDIQVFLDVAICHHGYIRELMRQEAQLVPEYAPTLQGHDFSDQLIRNHEEEFAAADRLFVLSTHARKTLLARGVDETKMIKTDLGVDLGLFTPGHSRSDGVFRIIFVGQITQRKGISYLIEAFRRAAIPSSELHFVGEVIGTPNPWIRVPGVRHVPPVPRAELPALYRAADVYVLPSLAEGFPLTSLEAMACGLPVIVSENTFAHDVLTEGHDGFVVPIRDAGAIAERLVTLYRDPDLRARMGIAARQTAERYPWRRYGEHVTSHVRADLA